MILGFFLKHPYIVLDRKIVLGDFDSSLTKIRKMTNDNKILTKIQKMTHWMFHANQIRILFEN